MHRIVAISCSLLATSMLAPTLLHADDEVKIAQAKQQTINQLKEIGIAMQIHHDTYKRFPPPAIVSADGKPLLSWRVKLLPLLEMKQEQELYKEFALDEPWDSEHNLKLLERMPAVYRCPLSKAADRNSTVYQVPCGPSTIFPPEGTSMRNVRDGTSMTIMLVETDEEHAVPWTKPDDWKFDPDKPGAGLAGHFPNVFFVGAADVSVHELPLTIETDTLRGLFTRDGREAVRFPD
jgi:hypothetical protein